MELADVQFIIQADFLTPASREGIRVDDPWNICLRDEIPGAFCESLSAMRGILSINFLEFIPDQAQHKHDKYLAPAVTDILKTIISWKIVRTRDDKEWITPTLAMIVPSSALVDDKPILSEVELHGGHLQVGKYR